MEDAMPSGIRLIRERMNAVEARIPVGSRFGKLETISAAERQVKHPKILCRCDCGTERMVGADNLRRGMTKSCGCEKGRPTHRGTDSPLYFVWQNMIQRCRNPRNISYKNYGARGISVCTEWRDFGAFRSWALATGYEGTLTIDRENNDEGYSPSNCRWVTRLIQQNNRRCNHTLIIFGESKTVSDWLRDPRCVVSRDTFYRRLGQEWPLDEALTMTRKARR